MLRRRNKSALELIKKKEESPHGRINTDTNKNLP